MAGAEPTKFEEQLLKLKFRSLTYTEPKRQQKVREVAEEEKQQQRERSYASWKHLNPGYFDTEMVTSTRAAQQYEEKDFQNVNKEKFRVKDKYTEYVEYVVRDHALARKAK